MRKLCTYRVELFFCEESFISHRPHKELVFARSQRAFVVKHWNVHPRQRDHFLHNRKQQHKLVSCSLTSPFSTNIAISEIKGQGWKALWFIALTSAVSKKVSK